ncbi:MAG: DUF5103 domain-containing protein [Bacteroidota bacterium]|nr:DUF5103 domain-containing protein [Bacteroidota bacterium]
MIDKIFDANVSTVQFTKAGILNSYPIMQLNTGELLTLQFDIIGEKNARNLQYKFEHCDADWTVSSMMISDYIVGVQQEYLETPRFGSSTFKQYAHYALNFPNATMVPKISGNYILKIYGRNIDKPILQRRFYVYENAVTVSATAHRPTYANFRDNKQEVDFSITYNNTPIIDPYRDIKVVVMQNYRTDNMIKNLKPTYVQGSQLLYDYQEENTFFGNNEFRPFDIRDFRFRGNGIRSWILTDTGYHAVLYNDEDRSIATWSNVIDLNGMYLVQNRRLEDINTGADFIWVDFKFTPAYQEDRKDIYIFGALSNWQLEDRFKLEYDRRTNMYSSSVLLKQGYYDYCYAIKGEDGKLNLYNYEGSHWETENNYTVFVYWRPPAAPGDMLIGYTVTNTIAK